MKELIVSKLILIIKVANGLIINNKSRIKDVIVELENNQLSFKVVTVISSEGVPRFERLS